MLVRTFSSSPSAEARLSTARQWFSSITSMSLTPPPMKPSPVRTRSQTAGRHRGGRNVKPIPPRAAGEVHQPSVGLHGVVVTEPLGLLVGVDVAADPRQQPA